MLFYYILPIFIGVVAISGYKNKNVGYFLLLIMLVFLMFRGDNVGRDTSNYIYEVSAKANSYLVQSLDDIIVSKFEFLFNLLCYIVWEYNYPPRTVLYVLSVVTFVFLFLSAKRFQVNLSIVLFFFMILGYYYHSFNISRQMAALSIGLYAISFLREERKKRFLFFVLIIISTLIHNSIIALIILYPFRSISLNRQKAAMIVFSLYLFFTIVPITPLFINFMSKFQLFYNEGYGSGGDFALVERNALGLLYSLMSGVLLLMIYHYRTDNKKTDCLDVLFLFSMLVTSVLTYGNLGTYRLSLSFSIIQCIFFADCFSKKGDTGLYVIFCSLVLINYYMTIQIPEYPYYMQF